MFESCIRNNVKIHYMNHKYFTIGEMLHSSTAIANRINNYKITPQIEANLDALITDVLDPAREAFGKPVIVSSGYRCPELNSHKDIKGKDNSQHLYGQAADLKVASGGIPELRRLFNILAEMPSFDQLLFESNSKGGFWIHVSYKANGGNRKYINSNYKA